MESGMEPATEFRLFPFLPLELRLNIWRFAAANHTRIIPFHPVAGNNREVLTYVHTPIPLLSVSREARAQALKSYTIVQDAEADDDYDDGYNNGNAKFPPLYFNPFRDTVGIANDMFLRGVYQLVAAFERYGICAGVCNIDGDRSNDAWAKNFSKRGYIYKPTTEKIAIVGELEPAGNRGFWWKGVTIGERDVEGKYPRGISVV